MNNQHSIYIRFLCRAGYPTNGKGKFWLRVRAIKKTFPRKKNLPLCMPTRITMFNLNYEKAPAKVRK